jgi:cytidylate kinase
MLHIRWDVLQFVVSGLTASGKSALGAALGEELGVVSISASAFFVGNLDDTRTKRQRMLSWLADGPVTVGDEAFEAGKMADELHLAGFSTVGDSVHESLVLARLLPASQDLCCIYLDIPVDVRAARVATQYGLSTRDARTIINRKDARTAIFMERAYGVQPGGCRRDVTIEVRDGELLATYHTERTVHRPVLVRALQRVSQ